MTCQQHAIDQLREAGIRLTPQRAMVLDVVYHSDGHLTADEVYEQVRAQSPYVDLSTVYRNLVFLRQQGMSGRPRPTRWSQSAECRLQLSRPPLRPRRPTVTTPTACRRPVSCESATS